MRPVGAGSFWQSSPYLAGVAQNHGRLASWASLAVSWRSKASSACCHARMHGIVRAFAGPSLHGCMHGCMGGHVRTSWMERRDAHQITAHARPCTSASIQMEPVVYGLVVRVDQPPISIMPVLNSTMRVSQFNVQVTVMEWSRCGTARAGCSAGTGRARAPARTRGSCRPRPWFAARG